ncbi:uncharacterized protein [Amphiura filiformis]|uniref:uncharacterized protein n=1 Tax=Amphiura filiformis TaxID=82378 RepID=UPI003B21EF49
MVIWLASRFIGVRELDRRKSYLGFLGPQQCRDVNGIEIAPVQQAQFIPLTEVLCLIISEMNKRKLMATQDTIRSKLGECYNKMPIPSPEIIHKSLTHLLNEKKIEHSGQGYFIIGVEQLSSTSNSDDDNDSGTEYSCRIKKPPQERAYLMYKDGQITKHEMPTFMIDKGTQTLRLRNDMQNPYKATRPVSFPANAVSFPAANPNTNPNGMQTIYEREPTSVGQSPQTTPEHTAATAAAASNFQRTTFSQSMREKRNSPSKKTVFDRTSSMRVKMDIETGYLTSDSEAKPSCFGKLLGKSAKKAAFMKATEKKNNCETFAAQFPPSDVHDPFFNVAHWQEKSPHKVAVNGNGNGNSKERIIEGAGNTAIVKEKKKKDGPLPKDSKSRNTQQYKVDHGKLTHTAQSLQQKYKTAAEESMPESEAEFVRPVEGKFRTKAVADQARPQKKKVLSIHSDKIKHYFSTLRDTRPQDVKPFQGIGMSDCDTDSQYTEEQLSHLPPGMDLPHVHSNSTIAVGADNGDNLAGQYCALPSESETESISAPSIVKKFVATSRHINETFSARKHSSPGAKQVGNSNNTSGGAPVRERPLGLSPSQPYPEQNGFNGRVTNGATNKQNGQKRAPLAGDDGDEFYEEDEIDDLIRHEMNHNSSPAGSVNSPSQAQAQRVFAAYPEFQNQAQNDGRMTHSNQNIHCAHKEEPSLLRFNQQKAGYDADGSDRGSRSLPTTPSHENVPGSRVVVHQRLESLCSSTGDSGFNSPRSSVSQGHNNNYDSPNGQQNALKRHSLGSSLDNTNVNELKMTKSPSSTSTRSTGSENTVKSQVEKRKHRNGDYPVSPGNSGSRGNLNRPNSFDVIGTL